jgi:hypothetical protein
MWLSHRPRVQDGHETMRLLGRVEERTEVDRFSKVNILQGRSTMLEHPGDAQSHRYLVLAIACPCVWRWAAVSNAFRFLPARVDGKYKKHLVSIRISPHSDKMRIGDSPSRSTLSPPRLSDRCAEV